TAFRADVSKRRYADWGELMHYCRYSAMPVGRFVLDLHGEDRSVWGYSDPLCSALQVINHLQDCAADYRDLNRVYLPLDAMRACGASVQELGATKSSPPLRACLKSIAERTAGLLLKASKLPLAVKDTRLGLETGAIVRLAQRLTALLITRDPLSERVHLSKPTALANGMQGVAATLAARLTRHSDFPRPGQGR
ncbi:MAG TPA: squalene/phytoene synthase family protein, partial [Methyloceanibacter sp.]|nr:squalene/phytoene synthase family protein [Methyloceanibacter sp.]